MSKVKLERGPISLFRSLCPFCKVKYCEVDITNNKFTCFSCGKKGKLNGIYVEIDKDDA